MSKLGQAKPSAATSAPIRIPAVAGLGFYLREAYRSFAREFDARLAIHRITHAQWVMLWFLAQAGTLTPMELARKASIQKASATLVVNSLKRRKLIRSVPDKADRRKVNLFLTEAGADLMGKLIDCAVATNAIPLSRFSQKQVDQLILNLQGLIEMFSND